MTRDAVPVDQIAVDTLLVVLSTRWFGESEAVSERGALTDLRERVASVQADDRLAAQLASRLDGLELLSVVEARARLGHALDRGDFRVAGQVLWTVARTPGAVWRMFEERARMAILMRSLDMCNTNAMSDAIAAK